MWAACRKIRFGDLCCTHDALASLEWRVQGAQKSFRLVAWVLAVGAGSVRLVRVAPT